MNLPVRFTGDKARLAEGDRESRFLAKICASVVQVDDGNELADLATGVDWDRLLALAGRHRVTALVAYGLGRSELLVSAELADHLQDAERSAQYAELATVAEIRRLVRSFDQDNLPVLLLKGVGVSLSAFGRLGLRHNRDIDLLVDEANVKRAEILLSAAGFVRVEPEIGMPADAERRWRRSHKDSVFVHPDRLSIVELHWRLFENRYLLPIPGDAWDEAATLDLPGSTVRCLPRNFALLYLCVHGAQHAWSRLKWLVDIDGLVSSMSVEEQSFILKRARTLGVIRAVEQALLLREAILGRNIDPTIRLQLPNDRTTELLQRLGLRCLRESGITEIEETRFATTAKSVSHYWLRRGVRYWLSELWFDLTNDTQARLPPSLWWLAPIARPFFWVGKVHRRT